MSGKIKGKAAAAAFAAAMFLAVAFSGCTFNPFGGTPGSGGNETVKEFASYANPMVGTGGHGHTFPGATMPFGMVQLSPDTDVNGWDWCSGYHYSDSSVMGFSHTHLSGTGCADYGDILLMPTTGALKTTPGTKDSPGSGYRSQFSHENETAEPGYYSVHLDDYNVDAELTVTERVGIHKYAFPATSEARVLIDLDHGVGPLPPVEPFESGGTYPSDSQLTIVNDTTVEGSRAGIGWVPRHVVYFVAEFSRPFSSYGTWNGYQVSPGSSSVSGITTGAATGGTGAYLDLDMKDGGTVIVKVGISFVSIEGARANLQAEAPGWDFDGYRQAAKEEWNRQLGKIEVFGGTEEQKATFYTALYHTMIEPNVFSDIDGQYIGPDFQVHTSEQTQYTLFSLWDTFRALHPLLTIIQPQKDADMIESMVNIYKNSGNTGGITTGWLPKWWLANMETNCMIGTHADSVIADAYVKGITDFDVSAAYEAMIKDSTVPGYSVVPGQGYGYFGGRYALVPYNTIGYVPADINLAYDNPAYTGAYAFNQAVSRTLEYAYDDFCIAQMAKGLGNTADYDSMMAKSKNYANLYDSATGFMRGKSVTGQWVDEGTFDPTIQHAYYCEGNAWQWTWFVPHDVPGLMELMGGKEKFVEHLDSLFQENSAATASVDVSGLVGQYAQGNEPVHHVAYLYDYAGRPWKTQETTRFIMDTLFNSTVAGLCGNDDCGQMSAWYVLSAMGFYQVCPSVPSYALGSPIFDKVIIHLDNGKDFTIEAKNNSADNKYIQSATLNGVPLETAFFNHSDITSGATIVLEMGAQPNTQWGAAPIAAQSD